MKAYIKEKIGDVVAYISYGVFILVMLFVLYIPSLFLQWIWHIFGWCWSCYQ